MRMRREHSRPRLLVSVCVYDMPREALRTILSAAAPYQKDVAEDGYDEHDASRGGVIEGFGQPLGADGGTATARA